MTRTTALAIVMFLLVGCPNPCALVDCDSEGDVTVHLVDADGNPIGGTEVVLVPTATEWTDEIPLECADDDCTTWTAMGVSVGTYDVYASGEGGLVGAGTVQIVQGEPSGDPNECCPPGIGDEVTVELAPGEA